MARGDEGRPPLRRAAQALRPAERPVGRINVTDPDSRNVKTRGGYLQGYNAQAATNEGQIVIAAEVTTAWTAFVAALIALEKTLQ